MGVIPTIAPYFLPDFIQRLSLQFHDLRLYIREAITSQLISAVLDGRLDIAIVALPISEPNLTEAELFKEEFVLVRPLADAQLPITNPEKLWEMRLLLLQEGHCFRDQALEYCKIKPSLTHDLMGGSSLSTLVQMVGSGMGVTLIPQMAVILEKRAASIAILLNSE